MHVFALAARLRMARAATYRDTRSGNPYGIGVSATDAE
jgi:hypothetical protein